MKENRRFYKLFGIIIIIGGLLSISCSHQKSNIKPFPLKEISEKKQIISVVGVDKKGEIRVFNSQSGKLIEDCAKRKTPCKGMVKRDKQGNPVFRNGVPVLLDASGNESKIISSTQVTITQFVGSYCVSKISGGKQYVDCSHPDYGPPPF